jgi:hypothetical protein
MKKFLGILTFILLATVGYSQEIKVTSGAITADKNNTTSLRYGHNKYTIHKKSRGFFSDRPGNHKPYDNYSSYKTTICPDENNKAVTIDFQQFSIEKFDTLRIYDVDKKNTGNLVGKYTGNASPGKIVSKRGCLDFIFTSDRSVVKTGWYGKLDLTNLPTSQSFNCYKFKKRIHADLKCGVPVTANNIRGESNYNKWGSCTVPGWESTGRELIYRFVNKNKGDLKFTLKEYNGSQPKVLNLYIANSDNLGCPRTCLGSISQPTDYGKESILIKNANPGTYYVVVDGNQPYASNQFKLSVECAGGDIASCGKSSLYYDDFENKHDPKTKHRYQIDYYRGDHIARVNHFWTKGGDGLRDAVISTDRASNGTQSLEFNRKEYGSQDVYLQLGDRFSGKYRISWDMYIAPHSTAFFGLFGGDNSDPWGSVSKEFGHNNGHEGRWFDVELYVDLDNNRYSLFLDNRCKSYGGSYKLNLNKLNFYGLPKAHFYVDNLCFTRVSRIPYVAGRSNDQAAADTKVTEVEKVSNNTAFTLAPNPATSEVFIDLSNYVGKAVNISIYNAVAKEVYTKQINEVLNARERISLDQFNNGLYIVSLQSDANERVIKKLVVSKMQR